MEAAEVEVEVLVVEVLAVVVVCTMWVAVVGSGVDRISGSRRKSP